MGIVGRIVSPLDGLLAGGTGIPGTGGGSSGAGGGGGSSPPPAAPPGSVDYTGLYDFLVGGVPFNAANSPQMPYRRTTQPYRKTQIDQAAEPGDQTLLTWWLRSQSTFHLGAGRQFMEPVDATDINADYQFATSSNVDVWTPGQVTLLPQQMVQSGLTATGTGGVFPGFISGAPAVIAWSGSAATAYTGTGDTLTSTALTTGTTGAILSACSDGNSNYFANATGIYKDGTLIWNTGSSAVVIAWVKQRLMAAIGPSVYELDVTGGPTLPTAKYTHPVPTWVFVGICEGPGAIYAGGHAGVDSEIFKFVLDTTGSVPTVSTGIEAGKLPAGEQLLCMDVYLGGYLALGTSEGLRINLITDSSGSFILGAQQFPPNLSPGPVTCLSGDHRFVYAAWNQANEDGTTGCVRVDISSLTTVDKFAFAPDRSYGQAGNLQGMAFLGDRLLALVAPAGAFTGGVFVDSTTLLAPGYVKTGRIRFHTLDDKLFKYLRMRCAPLVGSLKATIYDADGQPNAQPVVDTPQGVASIPEQPISLGPQEYVSLRFDLNPEAETGTPAFHGYQLKCLPAARRQRQEILMLDCYDREASRTGQMIGKDDWAVSRLLALERLDVASDSVLLQHLTAAPGGSLDRLVVIDEVQFMQTISPTPTGGWGGVIQLTVHSVDTPTDGT